MICLRCSSSTARKIRTLITVNIIIMSEKEFSFKFSISLVSVRTGARSLVYAKLCIPVCVHDQFSHLRISAATTHVRNVWSQSLGLSTDACWCWPIGNRSYPYCTCFPSSAWMMMRVNALPPIICDHSNRRQSWTQMLYGFSPPLSRTKRQ